MIDLWNQLAARANVTLDEDRHARLARFLDLLTAANETMNLTRIIDRPTAEVQHVGDALTLLPFVPAKALRLADVGSGGGVPGIPLAIVRPDVRVFLLEATLKKAAFLTRVVEELRLPNVVVMPLRAEIVARDPGIPKFEVVVARALAATDQLVQWCMPLVKPGGKLLAMKGPKLAEELPLATASIRRLGGVKPVIHPVELPGTTGRVVLEIPKPLRGPMPHRGGRR